MQVFGSRLGLYAVCRIRKRSGVIPNLLNLCPRQESNLHASRHTHLKRARLPIPPLGQALSGKRGSNSRPQPWQGCALPTELFPQLKVKRRRLELPRLAALPPQSSASTIPPPLHFRLQSDVVPKTGVEPARLSTHAPETCASTNSATWASIERKTRLELATPTLARLCSTN